MKHERNHRVFCFMVSLHISLILSLAFLLFTIPGFAQNTSSLEIWRLGENDDLAMEFDPCPGIKEIQYTIPDNAPAIVSYFPAGVADPSSDQSGCLPSKTNLYFSSEENYGLLTLSIALNGQSEFLICGDSFPLHKIMVDAPYGWQEEKIAWHYLSSGEHNLALETDGNDSYVYFDYIKLEGFRDSDQDGIIDQDEGYLDSDGDGFSDWQDADCATIPTSLSFPYEGTLLLTIKNKETCQVSHCLFIESLKFFDIYSLRDPNRNLPIAPAGESFTYGIFSLSLKILPDGGTVMFTLIPPSPFHGIEKVWAEDHNHRWMLISCGLIDNQMDFNITDGDLPDGDGAANGEITLSFGLTIPVKLQPYTQESCFISILNRKSEQLRSCLQNQRIP